MGYIYIWDISEAFKNDEEMTKSIIAPSNGQRVYQTTMLVQHLYFLGTAFLDWL